MSDKGIDRSNMYQALRDFPKQFEKSIEFAKDIKIEGKIDKIVITGMGGSAFPGDILKTYLNDIDIPIELSRNYSITTPVDQNTLLFASSFSGNTEETIASFYDALEKGCKIVVVTSGGKLEELSKKHNIPMSRIIKESENFQPRWSVGYFFGIFVSVLVNSGIITDREKELRDLGRFLGQLNLEEKAKELTKDLVDHILIIYTSDIYERSLARIIKIKFNENSKIQAFFNAFPEMNHNEMVGFTNIKGNYYFIIVEDPDEHPRIKKRVQIFKDILKEKGLNFYSMDMQGSSILEKIFSTIYFFDFVSYYLALEYGVDPTPVEMVEDLKKRLGPFL
ncbi:MAG: bifunctional phosphoglucose/phosphomannose isomerase [bacterium]|nr:bifunctional phosphoglucose/phosphomannose isomerase [bacterium]